jgi:transcriptional regulator GlxA family with amidase domain
VQAGSGEFRCLINNATEPRLLLFKPFDAASVAFTVGYESASQFSREYARMVGLPPMRDVARFRTPAPGAPAGSA